MISKYLMLKYSIPHALREKKVQLTKLGASVVGMAFKVPPVEGFKPSIQVKC